MEAIELRTRVTKVFVPLYHLESELSQQGRIRVRGAGRFLLRTDETRQDAS